MALYTIINTLLTCVTIYSTLLFVTVLLTWFPNIDWYKQPFAAMRQVTEPFLNLFRGLIPPVGGLDLSTILAFICLSLLQRVLASMAVSFN
ncbi:MAG: YggT family protein [Pseudanabaenaceae cyanobacterium bins.68]|nr:YggT family protein [Pseudanabaenaceae cyanobacterium bins.68]